MNKKLLKDLKKGEFFRVSPSENGRVFIRGEYDRYEKKYCCDVFDDISEYRLFKGTKVVFVDFTF